VIWNYPPMVEVGRDWKIMILQTRTSCRTRSWAVEAEGLGNSARKDSISMMVGAQMVNGMDLVPKFARH